MFLQPDLTNHISAKLMLMDRASEERDCHDNQELEPFLFFTASISIDIQGI